MVIFPTAYFAPITYYQAFVASNNPTIEAKEHFIKQTIRTRCEILGPNGKQLLSIPVEKPQGNKTSMENLRIVEDGWRKVHWKAIETSYSSSAFFDYYEMEIKALIFEPTHSLLELNNNIHQRILQWLDFDILTNYTTEFTAYKSDDFRLIDLKLSDVCNVKPYHQVFRSKNNCLPNLSILDLILNEGPMARKWF